MEEYMPFVWIGIAVVMAGGGGEISLCLSGLLWVRFALPYHRL